MIEERTVRLLVVDDDDDDLYLVNDALSEVKGTRYDVTAATSALAAMGELAKGTFDVIFSDYRLGAVTGIDFINHVRAAAIETPIILLTGLSDHVIDEAALKAGASDFVPKALINADVLDRSVRYAIAHAARQRLLQAVLKSTNSGVAVLNKSGQLTLWNPRFADFSQVAFGADPARLDRLVDLTIRTEEKDIAVGNRVVEAHSTELPGGGSVLALHDVTGRVNDLKERELAEQRIRKIALQDGLTGLPNRMAFNDYLDRCLETAAVRMSRIAVLSFDFNQFKEVNDVFGHAAGDKLLRSAAKRLTALLSSREYAARLGGDEFVLVQECADDESAKHLAERIVKRLSKPVEWENRVFEAGVSVGISFYPEHGQSRQELLANADLAMYRAKGDLTRSICVFDASMDQFVRERRKIAHELRSAIQNNELTVHFQPQFNTADGKLSGFEALVRWNHRSKGGVPPAEFIPVAEENGMIKEIDEWVLRQTCRAAVRWNLGSRVAVNVSAKAICQAGFANTVHSIVMGTGISPSHLELEVTETALIQDLNRALHTLRQIKSLGISIAMDDFGTGYSSLSLLNSFPFDRIKIDKSFIHQAGTNVRADAIFHSVIGLGVALRVPILVEGVETQEQLGFVANAKCEEVQGNRLGYPVPELVVENILARLAGTTVAPTYLQWQDALEVEFSRPKAVMAS
jgi:diguanylate cyclase (GGDEF)-like protein